MDDVISDQKAPLGRILHNFRKVTCPSVTSGSHGTTTIVRKKAGNDWACARDHFRQIKSNKFYLKSKISITHDFRFRSGPLPSRDLSVT
jgi:hypothetical protein